MGTNVNHVIAHLPCLGLHKPGRLREKEARQTPLLLRWYISTPDAAEKKPGQFSLEGYCWQRLQRASSFLVFGEPGKREQTEGKDAGAEDAQRDQGQG